MVRSFWWCAYGNFGADESGCYPLARQVVAHYRRLARWSCAELASQLGLTVRAVNRAEREGLGLDSVSRLRELSSFLKIPLALLVLCAVPGKTDWWKSACEEWPVGLDGCPTPGIVVKFYRKQKQWTQEQLASALGISALAVRKMENMNTSLDSLTRRRALQFLLAIPPVLLGLDEEHIAREFGGTLIGSPKSTAPELITLFRESVHSLFTGYHAAPHVQDRVSETLNWLEQAREVRTTVHGSEKSQMLEVESLGYQALANITNQYAPDEPVFAYSNKAVQLARASDKKDLLCVSLQRRATTLINRGHIDLAQRSLSEALSISVDDESLRLCRYGEAARILASVASNEKDRSAVLTLLDQYMPATTQDTFHLNCNQECVIIRTAQTFNLLADHSLQPQARDLLRRSSDLLAELSPASGRRSVLIKLALAQSYVGLGELEYAVTLAVEAIPLMKQTKSSLYLPQLAQIYTQLCKSKMRHDPNVARLGLYLHEHGIL